MAKCKISIIRLILSILIGSSLFYFIADKVFLFGWNFDLTNANHWAYVWKKWQNGWVINKSKDILFFVGLLSLLPTLLLSWFVVYKFPVKKILLLPANYLKNQKKKKLEQLSLQAALGPSDKQASLQAKKTGEKQLKVTTEKRSQIDNLRGKALKTAKSKATEGSADDGFVKTESVQQNKEKEALDRFNLWEGLASKLESENIFVLREMKINSFDINIFAITQTGLFLLCEGPIDGMQWSTTRIGQEVVWTSETQVATTPLVEMIQAKTDLEKYIQSKMQRYKDISVNACMILDHGNIFKLDDLLEYVEEQDVSVLRMGSCQTKTLPDTDALIEYIKSQGVSDTKMNDAMAIAIIDLMDISNG